MFTELLTQVIDCIIDSGKTEEEAEALIAELFDNIMSDETMVAMLLGLPLPPARMYS